MKMLTNKSTHLTGQFGQRRQQGNTLVPVLIALAIALAATAAFLLQGEGLIDDNKKVLATSEVASLLSEYNSIRALGVEANNVKGTDVPGIKGKNVYGFDIKFVEYAAAGTSGTGSTGGTATSMTYGTDGPDSCNYLLKAFAKSDGVASTACAAGTGKHTLTISLN